MYKYFLVLSLALIVVLNSCNPKIYCFTAEPAAVGSKDSVHINWKVRGKPTLMLDHIKIANPPADSLDLLEFSLYVKKGNKSPAHLKRQVTLLPDESFSVMVVRVDSLSPAGDSLVAVGINDSLRWKGVSISTIDNISNRALTIFHGGRTGTLPATSNNSDIWAGLPYADFWMIKSPLTEAEKKDHSLIPTRIPLKIKIQPTKK
jgi:hypothetical protein